MPRKISKITVTLLISLGLVATAAPGLATATPASAIDAAGGTCRAVTC